MTTTGSPSSRGERRRLRHEPVVVGQEVVRELDEEAARGGIVAAPEQRRVALRDRPRPRPIADPQPPRDLPVATARQRDEALVCSSRSAWRNRGTPLVPARFAREMSRHRLRQPTAERASRTRCGPRCPLADPAQVLLDRVAMAGQPGALGAWPDPDGPPPRSTPGPASAGRRLAAPTRTPWRDDDAGRVGDDRVEQLDLVPTTPWRPTSSAAPMNRTAP